MLGETLSDPDGTESGKAGITMRGLGLLPVSTVFGAEKVRRQVDLAVGEGALRGAHISGYEIHMGRTRFVGEAGPFARMPGNGPADGCIKGEVFGTYIHGLFDTGELTEKLACYLMERKGLAPGCISVESRAVYKERQYARLAGVVRESLDMEAIYRALR